MVLVEGSQVNKCQKQGVSKFFITHVTRTYAESKDSKCHILSHILHLLSTWCVLHVIKLQYSRNIIYLIPKTCHELPRIFESLLPFRELIKVKSDHFDLLTQRLPSLPQHPSFK